MGEPAELILCSVLFCRWVNAFDTKEVGLSIPLIVRLEGTNVAAGKEIIKSSGLNIIAAEDLDDAAQKACAAL